MSATSFLDGRVTLHAGDCRDVIRTLPDNSIDSVVSDPPYALVSIVKRFGNSNPADVEANAIARKIAGQGTSPHARAAAGFMGQKWDTGETAFAVEFWAEVLRVLKPGGHIVAFSGTRTYHRMVVAIEDAGFEIRDQIGYVFGSGFPKSHSVTKAASERICRCGAASIRECDVRPMRDACVSEAERHQEKHLEVLFDGVPEQGPPSSVLRAKSKEGGKGREELGLEGRRDVSPSPGELRLGEVCPLPGSSAVDGESGRLRDGASESDGGVGRPTSLAGRGSASRRPRAAEQPAIEPGTVAGQPKPQASGAWPLCDRCSKPIISDGLGTALKPAWEPICLARKPLDGTVAANVLEHGTGALNIDGARVEAAGRPSREVAALRDDFEYGGNALAGRVDGSLQSSKAVGVTDLGRWPANIVHDGSDEVLAAFPDSSVTGNRTPQSQAAEVAGTNWLSNNHKSVEHLDSGSAARFFYTAKADAEDRLGSKHPTVKPLDLMQYLCRLVTPPGGTILDPFAGTGTTGEAAWREGFKAILIEREEEYQADIARRMDLATKPTKRAAVAKTKNKLMGAEGTPLFGGEAA
jgi:DNA modification methylase